MIEHQGIFLPDGERHLQGWMDRAGEIVDGRGSYQIKKLRAATAYCRHFRTAIDVGAHVGMWSMQLAKQFDRVCSFEPVFAHRECFYANVKAANVTLVDCALGAEDGMVSIHSTPDSSGDSYVEGAGGVQMRRLDDFRFRSVDFIKIDCEGYELHVLRGGTGMIVEQKPVIIVEQKPGKAQRFGLGETDAVGYLKGLGYRQAEVLSGDYVMVPA